MYRTIYLQKKITLDAHNEKVKELIQWDANEEKKWYNNERTTNNSLILQI